MSAAEIRSRVGDDDAFIAELDRAEQTAKQASDAYQDESGAYRDDLALRSVAVMLPAIKAVADIITRRLLNRPDLPDAAAAFTSFTQKGTLILRLLDIAIRDRDTPSSLREECRRISNLGLDLARRFVDLAAQAGDNDARDELQEHVQHLEYLIKQVTLDTLIKDAETARDLAQESAEQAQDAAGDAGATSLGRHFDEFARTELQTANRFRWACIGLASIPVGATVLLAFRTPPTETSVVAELARLSFVIPLAALAAYLGKQSESHRNSGRWAQRLNVQLRTIRAYTADLPLQTRDTIRADFAARVFGTAPSTNLNGASPSVLSELSELVSSASNLATAIGPPNGTKRSDLPVRRQE